MELHELRRGQVVEFVYQGHGRRRVVVFRRRDTWRHRVESKWLAKRPKVKRSRWLVLCWDLDKQAWRQFYSRAVEGLTEAGKLGREWVIVERTIPNRYLVRLGSTTLGEYLTAERAGELAAKFVATVERQPISVASLLPKDRSRSA